MRFTGLKYLQLLACLGLFACGSAERYDVVIVGGGASGTAAGLQAARMGARTLIVEEFDWLGGMLTSAGVSATDGNYRLRGGWRRIDGPYFKQWIEWRASVIYNFFKRTKEELKAVKPGLKFGAYTGAWYPSYFEVGVNWASNTYDPSQDFAWATPEYKNYGYAELLDIFTNGNYYWNVTVDEYRRSNGLHKNETDSEMSKGDHLSVEGGCRYSRRLLGGRPFFGGMYVEDYKRDTTRFKRAVEMNLRESDGLMVFDIVHIINRDWWGPLQRAVSAYEAEAKQ